MSESAPRYPEWKAPADDGRLLIWPQPQQLLTDTIQNHELLSGADSVRLEGVSLTEARARMRSWVGHRDDRAPLIATGHQTELYHPGVWAKLALISNVARKIGGAALQFAVDTDGPKHLHLRWPGNSMPVTEDPAISSAAWSGL